VVAGGRGTRLGTATPKYQVRFGGTTLLQRAVRNLEQVADQVIVVTPRERRPARVPKGSRWVRDSPLGEGPLAGVVGGLRAAPYRDAVVLGVDFPLLDPEFLRALIEMRRHLGVGAVVPCEVSTPQPLLAAYAPRAADLLEAALRSGERSVIEAVRTLEPFFLSAMNIANLSGGLDNLVNVNTPENLAAARRRYAELARQ